MECSAGRAGTSFPRTDDGWEESRRPAFGGCCGGEVRPRGRIYEGRASAGVFHGILGIESCAFVFHVSLHILSHSSGFLDLLRSCLFSGAVGLESLRALLKPKVSG